MMEICAVDLGASGGIAIWKNEVFSAVNMPDTEQGICDFIKDHRYAQWFVEDVGSNGIYGSGMSSSAGAHFAKHRGFWEGCLTALNCNYIMVRPQEWMGKITKKKQKDFPSKGAWKNYLKDLAKQYFPDVKKITLKTSDALLILKYGIERLQEEERLQMVQLF